VTDALEIHDFARMHFRERGAASAADRDEALRFAESVRVGP